MDTDSDGYPDTGPLAPAASATILVVYAVPGAAAPGDSATVTITVASDFQPLATASVTDTIDIVLAPNLLLDKRFSTVSDPVNLGTDPLPIPGSVVEYTITVTNTGPGTVDMDSIEITDAIPDNSCLLVVDIAGNGPVRFDDGSPVAGPDGCDPAVSHMRINPKGLFQPDTGSGSPQAGFSFRILID